MSKELKLYRHCGSIATLYCVGTQLRYFVCCQSCGLSSEPFQSRVDAIVAWNMMSADPPSRKVDDEKAQDSKTLRDGRNRDARVLRSFEKKLAKAIEKELEGIADEGAYWHYPGLCEAMASAAMLVLKSTSDAAQWGKDEGP